MEVRCTICGATSKLSKAHKDYQKLAKHPSSIYICEKCSTRIQLEMQHKLNLCKKK